MKKRYVLIIIMVLAIPLLLGINAWQANKCGVLQREINRLQKAQVELTEKNREEIAVITELLSTDNLESNVWKIPGLVKMPPEDITLIRITGGNDSGR